MAASECAPGWAQMVIDGKLVIFDTTRYRGCGDRPVVRVHHDGSITVGPVNHDCASTWHGARGAMGPWVPDGPGGAMSSSPVVVLGLVLSEAPL